MKLVVAFVHPAQAGRVVRALEKAGVYHLSLSQVHGILKPDAPIVRADMGGEGEPEVRLEAYCEDGRVEHIVGLIRDRGHVGELPSGTVFVHPVDHAWGIGHTVAGER